MPKELSPLQTERLKYAPKLPDALKGAAKKIGLKLGKATKSVADQAALNGHAPEVTETAEAAEITEVPQAEGPAEPATEDPDPVPLARLEQGSADGGSPARPARPARIVLYRRPLMARAEGDEELGDLVLDVVVEEFARLLGLDPQIVDPGYPEDED